METKYRITREQQRLISQTICRMAENRDLRLDGDEVERAMRLFDSVNKSTRRGIFARLLSLFW